MTPLEQRIAATIARAKRQILEPKSLYLSADDMAELGNPAEIGGLPVKRVGGLSRLYCRHGICRHVRADRRPYEKDQPARPPP